MSNHSLTVLINRRTSLCLNKTYLEAVHVLICSRILSLCIGSFPCEWIKAITKTVQTHFCNGKTKITEKKSSLRNSSTRNSFEKTSYSSDISWKLVQNTEQKYSVESVPWISGVFVFCVEPGPCVNANTIRSLSNGVFEWRTSTGSALFSFFDGGFAQIFSQIASITVKKLRNTNFISSRHVKRENTSLPVDVRRSKTSLLKLPNIWRIEPHGISAIKCEAARLHFLSDVFVADAPSLMFSSLFKTPQ